jgi:hypothetical protein
VYQQEKLPFTCSPTGAALSGTITDITLWNNSTSGWKRIVKIWLKIENGQVVNEEKLIIFLICITSNLR